MKVVVDQKTGRKVTVFEKFEISEDDKSCPKCKRQFKEYDIKFLSENRHISCSKCGSKLSYKN